MKKGKGEGIKKHFATERQNGKAKRRKLAVNGKKGERKPAALCAAGFDI